jgi:hypothetical protein
MSLCLLLALASVVGAVPPLPPVASGRVLVDGADAPAGTIIEAWMNGAPVARATVALDDAGVQSWYMIEVPGADSWNPDTGAPPETGSAISFTVAGLPANQSIGWSAGTFRAITLTMISAIPTPTPTPSPTPIPENDLYLPLIVR